MKRSRSTATDAGGDHPIPTSDTTKKLTRSNSSFSANAGADGLTEHAIAATLLAPLVASTHSPSSSSPLFSSTGYFVIGCDEAGRGPLAGPVVASACCVYIPPSPSLSSDTLSPPPHGSFLAGLSDSKMVQEAHREALLEQLIAMISASDEASDDASTPPSSLFHSQLLAYYKSGGVALHNASASSDAAQALSSARVGSSCMSWHFQHLPKVVEGVEAPSADDADEDGDVTPAAKGPSKKKAAPKRQAASTPSSPPPLLADPSKLPPSSDICVFGSASSSSYSSPQLVAFSSSLVPPQSIDAVNILHASLHGMMTCSKEILAKLPDWWEARRLKGGGAANGSAAGGGSLPLPLPLPLPPVLLLCDGNHLPLEVLPGGAWDAACSTITTTADAPTLSAVGGEDVVDVDAVAEDEEEVGAGTKGSKAKKKAKAAPKPKPTKAPKPVPSPFERRLKANPHLVPSPEAMGVLLHGGGGGGAGGYTPPSAFTTTTGAADGAKSLSAALVALKAWRAEYNAKPPAALAATVAEGSSMAAPSSSSSSSSPPILLPLPVIKGDALCPSIAAASILAKQLRDHYMIKVLDPSYPVYGLADHKGYPTPTHCEALRRYGAVPSVHRFTFGPVKDVSGK